MQLSASLDAFFWRRVGGDAAAHLCPLGRLLQRELAQAIVPVPGSTVARRRPSMCHDGTPVVYSLKLGGANAPPYRILVEPGGLGITVAEQIAFSLQVTDRILGLLSWRDAASALNAVTTRVFPPQASAVNSWWGGIWLGAAIGPGVAELRLYLNLRHGDAAHRWQRVADVVARFGDASLERPLRAWMRRTHAHAIPVGLGIVVSGGRLRGIRVYVGLHKPAAESLLAAVAPTSPRAEQELTAVCRGFNERFGGFAPQSVTVGYDFLLDEAGVLQPAIARTKVDLCCQLIAPSRRAALDPWIRGLLADRGQALDSFQADLTACFGGFKTEFVSLGFRPDLDHVTVYCRPANDAEA